MPIHPTSERLSVGGLALPIEVHVYQDLAARPAPLVLHMPGGTFVRTPADPPVAALLAEAGAVVVSADYPAGALHPFPHGVGAMYALLCHLHDHRTHWAARASQLFVAGEEAGGNLAAALALIARDRLGPPLAGQILLSPMLDAGMATCSIRDAEAGPVGCKWADGWGVYLRNAGHAAHPYAVPARATRLKRLPPALAITTPDDPMRDECLAYVARLKEAGVGLHVRAIAADDWPDALARPLPAGGRPSWADAVRDNAAAFFASVAPDMVPAAVTAEATP